MNKPHIFFKNGMWNTKWKGFYPPQSWNSFWSACQDARYMMSFKP